jgi:hypothetical protein
MAIVLALAVLLAIAPAAQAKSSAFKATIQFEEAVKTTVASTDTSRCQEPPLTATQTMRARTTSAQPVTAHIVDAGSSRGLVELGPSGSGYASIPGVTGTIERHAEGGSGQCGPPRDPQDCGTKSPKRWDLMVQPQSARRSGRIHLKGLAVFAGPLDGNPFSNCPSPEYPPPALMTPAKIAPAVLFDARRRKIVLRIKGTAPWHTVDNVRQTVTDGTYSRSITLTLRRTG